MKRLTLLSLVLAAGFVACEGRETVEEEFEQEYAEGAREEGVEEARPPREEMPRRETREEEAAGRTAVPPTAGVEAGEGLGAPFGEVDANDDTRVDRREFERWSQRAISFDQWDMDGDGSLDRTELSAALFDLLDANDDSAIGQDEWPAAMTGARSPGATQEPDTARR